MIAIVRKPRNPSGIMVIIKSKIKSLFSILIGSPLNDTVLLCILIYKYSHIYLCICGFSIKWFLL